MEIMNCTIAMPTSVFPAMESVQWDSKKWLKMLDHLKWPLLEQRRNYLKLIMFYKILHGLMEVVISLTPSHPLPVDTGSISLPLLPELKHIYTLFTIYYYSVELSTQLTNWTKRYWQIQRWRILTSRSSLLINCVYDYLCVILFHMSFTQ